MILLDEIKVKTFEDGHPKTAIISATSDTKEEVGPGMTIVDLPDGCIPLLGSSIMTVGGDITFVDSSGNWDNWQ